MKRQTEDDAGDQGHVVIDAKVEKDTGDTDLQSQSDELKTVDNACNETNSGQKRHHVQDAGVTGSGFDLERENNPVKDERVANNLSHENQILKKIEDAEGLNVFEGHVQREEETGEYMQAEEEGTHADSQSDGDESFVWKDGMGEFGIWDIAHALADGSVDEHFKAMLKKGFESLLAGE